MRISKIAILASLAGGVALSAPAFLEPAFAVQDQPMTMGGIEAVCTGVGSAKDNPAWGGYPVKLVFANSAGENLAAVHVALKQGGKTVLETDCDAPWLLLKAKGDYAVTAMVGARVGNASFSSNGSGPQKEITVTLPPAK